MGVGEARRVLDAEDEVHSARGFSGRPLHRAYNCYRRAEFWPHCTWSGVVQFRPAEALVVLPVLYPETIWGLYLGCLAANLLGGLGVGCVWR